MSKLKMTLAGAAIATAVATTGANAQNILPGVTTGPGTGPTVTTVPGGGCNGGACPGTPTTPSVTNTNTNTFNPTNTNINTNTATGGSSSSSAVANNSFTQKMQMPIGTAPTVIGGNCSFGISAGFPFGSIGFSMPVKDCYAFHGLVQTAIGTRDPAGFGVVTSVARELSPAVDVGAARAIKNIQDPNIQCHMRRTGSSLLLAAKDGEVTTSCRGGFRAASRGGKKKKVTRVHAQQAPKECVTVCKPKF